MTGAFKKDSKLNYSNYHPISLLSNIEEKNFKNLCIKDCIFPHALINITENIRIALDDGNVGCVVFVNINFFFDTVDDQIMGFVEFQMTRLNSIHLIAIIMYP